MPRVVLGLNPEKTLKLQKMLVEKTSAAAMTPEAVDFLRAAQEQLLHFINYVLHRNSLLGEGRALQSSHEARKFAEDHSEEIGPEIERIVESHLLVLEIIEAELGRKNG
jgi:hypothetical protein